MRGSVSNERLSIRTPMFDRGKGDAKPSFGANGSTISRRQRRAPMFNSTRRCQEAKGVMEFHAHQPYRSIARVCDSAANATATTCVRMDNRVH